MPDKPCDDEPSRPLGRARDLGVPFDGTPGALNAITDVHGVEVGHKTLIRGEGSLVVGEGPVRTGVTAILPRGRSSTYPVYAAWSVLNASGEMTGTVWLEERGLLDGPIVLTNTHSVGVARDAVVGWMNSVGWDAIWHAPIIAETYDGILNDINGFHVTDADIVDALEAAACGPVEEGSVGGGTGMICHGFKGGIGTASRCVAHGESGYTVGVLVQSNYGHRDDLRIAGIPVGRELSDRYLPTKKLSNETDSRVPESDGSIIVVIATDAPLLPHQLKRLSRRGSLGIGRMGSIASAGSGDIFLAFSIANTNLRSVHHEVISVETFPDDDLTVLFRAAVEASEEAIVNALVAAKDMTGADGNTVFALPHDELQEILARLIDGKRMPASPGSTQ